MIIINDRFLCRCNHHKTLVITEVHTHYGALYHSCLTIGHYSIDPVTHNQVVSFRTLISSCSPIFLS